jgi:cyclopropane fatty-acyl-phospholipid synthase-like methyltransferase
VSDDRGADFDASYGADAPPPWDIGRPQSAFAALAAAGELGETVLDAGCGTGEHALIAAVAGYDATGIDLAPTAIRIAEDKARQRGLAARFLVGDALRLSDLGQQFDTVLDCGLFHTFDDDDRARYVGSLAAVVPTGGRVHLLCFSDAEPGDWGPRRVTEAELREAFAHGWEVERIEPSVLDVTLRPEPVPAWLCTVTRR